MEAMASKTDARPEVGALAPNPTEGVTPPQNSGPDRESPFAEGEVGITPQQLVIPLEELFARYYSPPPEGESKPDAPEPKAPGRRRLAQFLTETALTAAQENQQNLKEVLREGTYRLLRYNQEEARQLSQADLKFLERLYEATTLFYHKRKEQAQTPKEVEEALRFSRMIQGTILYLMGVKIATTAGLPEPEGLHGAAKVAKMVTMAKQKYFSGQEIQKLKGTSPAKQLTALFQKITQQGSFQKEETTAQDQEGEPNLNPQERAQVPSFLEKLRIYSPRLSTYIATFILALTLILVTRNNLSSVFAKSLSPISRTTVEPSIPTQQIHSPLPSPTPTTVIPPPTPEPEHSSEVTPTPQLVFQDTTSSPTPTPEISPQPPETSTPKRSLEQKTPSLEAKGPEIDIQIEEQRLSLPEYLSQSDILSPKLEVVTLPAGEKPTAKEIERIPYEGEPIYVRPLDPHGEINIYSSPFSQTPIKNVTLLSGYITPENIVRVTKYIPANEPNTYIQATIPFAEMQILTKDQQLQTVYVPLATEATESSSTSYSQEQFSDYFTINAKDKKGKTLVQLVQTAYQTEMVRFAGFMKEGPLAGKYVVEVGPITTTDAQWTVLWPNFKMHNLEIASYALNNTYVTEPERLNKIFFATNPKANEFTHNAFGICAATTPVGNLAWLIKAIPNSNETTTQWIKRVQPYLEDPKLSSHGKAGFYVGPVPLENSGLPPFMDLTIYDGQYAPSIEPPPGSTISFKTQLTEATINNRSIHTFAATALVAFNTQEEAEEFIRNWYRLRILGPVKVVDDNGQSIYTILWLEGRNPTKGIVYESTWAGRQNNNITGAHVWGGGLKKNIYVIDLNKLRKGKSNQPQGQTSMRPPPLNRPKWTKRRLKPPPITGPNAFARPYRSRRYT